MARFPLLKKKIGMKIVHICISAPYIDGWGYQENLLPEYLNSLGVENYVIASSSNFPTYLKQEEILKIQSKGRKYQYNGITVYRLNTCSLSSNFIVTCRLSKVLEEIKPDIILHHNINPTSLLIASRYSKKNGCTLLVDNHADEINMNKNKAWVAFYHKFLVRFSCKCCDSTITKYLGVTHSRCDFIRKYYKIPEEKIELLPIGADTKFADTIDRKDILRVKYGFSVNDFIVVSGGKMGLYKGTDILIKSVKVLCEENLKMKLILFGTYEDSSTKELAESNSFITQFGWCDRKKTLELLKLANVACWPIHHTTLIEDAISVNTPIILRKTKTTEHLIAGNGAWIDPPSIEKLSQILRVFVKCPESDKKTVRDSAVSLKRTLSYDSIAKRILELR